MSTGHWITRRNTQGSRNKDLIVLVPHAGPIDAFNGLRTPLRLRLFLRIMNCLRKGIRAEAGHRKGGDKEIMILILVTFCNLNVTCG